MSTIVLRSVKGTPLTNTEVDTNFTNLNTDKLEAATSATLTNKTINLTSNTLVATSAQLLAAITDETGTGSLVFNTSPTLVTPILGTPQSGNFSTGTFTWPTFNQNTTGTAAGLSATLATTSGGTGLTSFTSGGVVYASSSSALATGSALTFDGTTLEVAGNIKLTNTSPDLFFNVSGGSNYSFMLAAQENVSNTFEITPSTTAGGSTFTSPVYSVSYAGLHKWFNGSTQAMTLSAAGNLTVGTTSSIAKFNVGSVSVGSYPTYSGPSAGGFDGGFLAASTNYTDNYTTMLDIGSVTAGTDATNGGSAIRFLTQPRSSPYALIERARIDTIGNVGIGRTSPAYLIDAYDVAQGATTMRLLNTYGLANSNGYGYSRFQGLSAGNGLFLSQNVNGINGASSVLDSSSHSGYAISMGENYGGWAFLKYAAGAGTVTPSLSMFLTSAGDLLVGATSASGIITTSTSVNSQAGSIYTRNTHASAGSYSGLTIGNNLGINHAGYILTSSNQPLSGFFGPSSIYAYASTGLMSIVTETANPIIFGTNGTQRGIFDASGNLCIGSGSAGSAGTIAVSVGNPGVTTGGLQLWATTSTTHYVQFGDGTAGSDSYRGAVGYNHTNDSMVFYTSAALKASLDSSGNFGLGVAPNAWTDFTVFQNQQAAILGYDGQTHYTQNAYYQSGTWKYIRTAELPATRYTHSSGYHYWFSAPSGAGGSTLSWVQAMTLDSNGTFRIKGAGTAGSTDAVQFSGSAPASSITLTANGDFLVGGTATINSARLYVEKNVADNIALFNNTASSPFGPQFRYANASPNGTGNPFLECYDNPGTLSLKLALRSNGGLANYSANNVNLSDRREKTNFAPAKSYLDVICAIPVQTFNYIDQNLEEDGGLTLGVVAQDVQAVAPELVMESNWGTQDEPKMRLSIYQTDLQYALMKALQELKAEFDAYKASHP